MRDPSTTQGEDRIAMVAVGPQRTATSWLDRALRAHPRMVLPANVKETYFFDLHYDRGWEWYSSHFGPRRSDAFLVEVCSTYFESRAAKERIRDSNRDARIVITVRNPIARTFSFFIHEYAKGRVSDDFAEAVVAQPRIVTSGHYAVLAPQWEEAFGRERVLYMVQEDIELDPQRQLDGVCAFLGIEPIELPEHLRNRYGQGAVPRFPWLAAAASHAASALRGAGFHRLVEAGKRAGLKRVYRGGDRRALAMTRPIFERLLAEHEADIAFLESRLGRAFPHWRDPACYGLEG